MAPDFTSSNFKGIARESWLLMQPVKGEKHLEAIWLGRQKYT